jgi:hypothetical protein
MHHTAMSSFLKGASLIALAAACTLASAQRNGTYVGRTDDDHAVSITVKTGQAGNFYIAELSGGYALHCPKTGDDQDIGLVWTGNLGTVHDGQAKLKLVGDLSYQGATLNFTTDSHISGKIAGGIPEFADSPKSTQSCLADFQHFDAYFVFEGAALQAGPVPSRQAQAQVDAQGRISEQVMTRPR